MVLSQNSEKIIITFPLCFQDSTREMRIDTFVSQVKERYENKK